MFCIEHDTLLTMQDIQSVFNQQTEVNMTKQQAKQVGENFGIFMVCVGLWLLYIPCMRILVDIAKIVVEGGAQ